MDGWMSGWVDGWMSGWMGTDNFINTFRKVILKIEIYFRITWCTC